VQRRGGCLRSVVISVLVAVAVGGALLGPRLAADAAHGGGMLAAAKRKLKALHDYALFRAKGDRAVLHFDDPAKARKKK
jgi:hypothetical protein